MNLLKNFSILPNDLGWEDKIDLSIVTILVITIFTGISLCQYSFDGAELVHPAINFAGMIIMLILPGSAGIILCFCRKIDTQGPWAHCQTVWKIFFPYMVFATLFAFLSSSDGGYVPYKTVFILSLAWLGMMGIATLINYILRRQIVKEEG